VTLVVHVEAVAYGVVLEVGDESGDVDRCHTRSCARGQGCRPQPATTFGAVGTSGVLDLLADVAGAIEEALGGLDDWGLAGTRAGQYRSDLAADEAALRVLDAADVGVFSEESGLSWPERELIVVVDPLDGSTNAARGIPWFATSLCAVDSAGPVAALVINLANGQRYHAERGGGAFCDGVPIRPSACTTVGEAVVGLSGFPPRALGWKQYRTLGAAALDICAVAAGVIDGYVDCSRNAHGLWDYAGGLLMCVEAGAAIADADGRDLVVRDPADKRTPVAAATPELLEQLVAARATF
jgi:fructose-1,6-bisphosphatase/inositol monophosphatase family enzyme